LLSKAEEKRREEKRREEKRREEKRREEKRRVRSYAILRMQSFSSWLQLF